MNVIHANTASTTEKTRPTLISRLDRMQYPVAHPLHAPIMAAINAGMSKYGFIFDEQVEYASGDICRSYVAGDIIPAKEALAGAPPARPTPTAPAARKNLPLKPSAVILSFASFLARPNGRQPRNICLLQIVPHFQVLNPYIWIDRTFRSQPGENRSPESWRLRKILRHGMGLAALKCHLDVPSQPLRLHTAGIDQ